MSGPGRVVVSLDFELAWGTIDKPSERARLLSEDGSVERAYLDRLLSLCDRLRIPITFATVGHLHLDSCDGHRPRGHPDGWFDADPETDAETDPQFYAPDALDAIRDTDVDHEIGTHTFSHAICDSVSGETVEWELDRVAAVHDANELDRPRSLVAPRNRLPRLDVVRDSDIDVVRVSRPAPAESRAEQLTNRLRQWAGDFEPPLADPYVRDGVTVTESTPQPSLTTVMLPNGQRDVFPPFRAIPTSIRQRRHERYLLDAIDAARRSGQTVHLWSHLYNLSNDAQWQPIESAFRTIAAYRDAGEMTVETMSDLTPERSEIERSESRA